MDDRMLRLLLPGAVSVLSFVSAPSTARGLLRCRRADQSRWARRSRPAGLAWVFAAVCVCALPSTAVAAWSKPERLSSTGGDAFGADLRANGSLMLEWSGQTPYVGGPIRTGFVVARPGAAPSPIAPSPLAKNLPNNNNRSVYQLGYLTDGRAVRCWMAGPGGGQLWAGIYSASGALTRSVRLAVLGSWVGGGSAFTACHVAVSGNKAVIGWAPMAAPGATAPPQYQGVVFVARVSTHGRFSSPLAIPVANSPLQSNESTWLSSLSLTSTGWVALSWIYEDWMNRSEKHLACSYQASLTWLSPSDQPTPSSNLTGLQQTHDGAICSGPPAAELGAVGGNSALVVYEGARLRSELITTTGSTRMERAARGAFGVADLDIVAGGGKVVAVSGGGYITRRRYAPVRAEEWYAGRWHAPQVVVGALPSYAGSHAPVLAYPAPAELFVNARGQAAIVCSAVDSLGFSFGYVGSFDF